MRVSPRRKVRATASRPANVDGLRSTQERRDTTRAAEAVSFWGGPDDVSTIEVRPRVAVAADLVLRQLDPSPLGDAAGAIDELRPLYECITSNAVALAFGEESKSRARRGTATRPRVVADQRTHDVTALTKAPAATEIVRAARLLGYQVPSGGAASRKRRPCRLYSDPSIDERQSPTKAKRVWVVNSVPKGQIENDRENHRHVKPGTAVTACRMLATKAKPSSPGDRHNGHLVDNRCHLSSFTE